MQCPKPGGTPRKNGWGCAARFPKLLPYLWPKFAIFPTLFMTWPKIGNPIYYDPTITSRKHTGSIASWKHTHIKARVQKPNPIYDQNDQNQLKSIPKRLKSYILWAVHTCKAHIRKSPPGFITTCEPKIDQLPQNEINILFVYNTAARQCFKSLNFKTERILQIHDVQFLV